MTVDVQAVALLVGPTIGALVWLGILFSKVKRTEADVLEVRRSLHELKNYLTRILTDVQIDIAKLTERNEG